jgi:RNA-directed DNA polymerase
MKRRRKAMKSFESVDKTKQETETKGILEKYGWVEAGIWTDRMLIALENGVKGNKWYSLMDKVYNFETLWIAWTKVRKNRGAAGIDQISIERFSNEAIKYICEMEESLKTGMYKPNYVKRVQIPKGNGKARPLGIPTVKDRIVQTAIKMVLEPIWEKEFYCESYGFRPNKSAHQAIIEVDRFVKLGYTHIVDADILEYFDNIPHDLLIGKIKDKIADGKLLAVIKLFLKQGIMEGTNKWKPTQGTPQGAVLSPLLSNIYLHSLDQDMIKAGFKMIRYADDFVVLCKTKEQAIVALSLIQTWVKENKLQLHPEKTQIGNCMIQKQSFEFLGYKFENGYRFVRKKSYCRLKDKIRELTKRANGYSLEKNIKRLNRILVGWFNYFKLAQGQIFRDTDRMIRRRLRAILRKRERRPGMGKTLDDHKKWENIFFAEQGLFILKEAKARWLKANQP